MPSAEAARPVLLKLVSAVEQEIRARPRIHRAFYSVVARNVLLRRVAGSAKDSIRGASRAPRVPLLPPDDPAVSAHRRTAVAVRLGFEDGAPP